MSTTSGGRSLTSDRLNTFKEIPVKRKVGKGNQSKIKSWSRAFRCKTERNAAKP